MPGGAHAPADEYQEENGDKDGQDEPMPLRQKGLVLQQRGARREADERAAHVMRV